jgi:hypothetical protein
LAPFPVAASVLITAAHLHHGFAGAMQVLSGILIGLISFACFCAVLSHSIVPWGIGGSFAVALTVGAIAQVAILKFLPKS